jgi:hypothetical protein
MKAKSALIASISTVGIACPANAQDFTSAGGTFVFDGPHIVDLVIGASGTIADLDITTNWASHFWMGDLNVTLTHVDTGTTAAIFEDVGPFTGFATDLVGAYRFDDESANSFLVAAGSGNPVPTGTYQAINAAEAQSFLSVFDGESISGTWRLSITDDYPSRADGTLTNFTLHMTVPAPGALGLLGAAGLAGLGRRRSRR